MITIRIGVEARSLADVTESWINEQINRRRQDGQNICVEVTINTSGINVRLATPGCGASPGGGRPANGNELELIDLWSKRGLSSSEFSGGNLIAFLKQLRRTVS